MIATLVKMTKPVVVVPEKETKKQLLNPSLFKVQSACKPVAKNETALLVLSLNGLRNHPKDEFDSFEAILVHSDNVNAVLPKVSSKKVADRLYIFNTWQELNKILRAWGDGTQERTIATAWVEGDCLVIKTCAMQEFSISFKTIPLLANIAFEDRPHFKIHEFGNYLHWPDYDVHLDIDTVRYYVDKKYKHQKDIETLTYYQEYGKTIADFRKLHKLTQKDIEALVGLSARQLYRVESGEQKPTAKFLEKLARAHRLELNRYLNTLAELIQQKRLKSEKQKPRREAASA